MNAKDKTSDYIALHSVVQNDKREVSEELFKAEAKVNQKNHSEDTPSMRTGNAAEEEDVSLLLESGPVVNTIKSHGKTASIYTTRHWDDKCMYFLIKAGADVNATD